MECPKSERYLGDIHFKIRNLGASLAIQWLRLHAPTAEGMGLIPGQGPKNPDAAWYGQKFFFNKIK